MNNIQLLYKELQDYNISDSQVINVHYELIKNQYSTLQYVESFLFTVPEEYQLIKDVIQSSNRAELTYRHGCVYTRYFNQVHEFIMKNKLSLGLKEGLDLTEEYIKKSIELFELSIKICKRK